LPLELFQLKASELAGFMMQPFTKKHEGHEAPFGLYEGAWRISSVKDHATSKWSIFIKMPQ